jgi:ferritin-like metal-binding protein YciE
MNTMDELLEDMIQDLYNAEKQLTKALPKMAKKCTNDDLKKALETHLKETEGQVEKLEQVCKDLGIKPTGKVCKAMQGLIEEGEEVLSDGKPSPIMDAGIIGAAQKVEHYEIAGYGTARTIADQLGHMKAAKNLEQILEQEKAADAKLNDIAMKSVNREAMQASGPAGRASLK